MAGLPPYERGYRAMGYLEGMPSLRIVAMEEESISLNEPTEILYQNIENFTQSKASCKSLVITAIDTLPQTLSLKEAQYLYIPASSLRLLSLRRFFLPNLWIRRSFRML